MITFPFDEASEEFEENNPKIFKKVEFVSLGVMKKLQQNQSITFDQFHVLDERYLIDTGDLEKLGIRNYYQKRKKSHIKRQLEAIQERISVFNIVEEQKVRISRKTSDSDPYIWPKFIFQKSEYFTNDKGETDNYELYSGFYFLLNLDGMNKEQSAKVKAALRLIMDQGLGGKRSLGNGLVDDIEFIELKSSFEYQEVFTIKSNGGYMNLSLVYPTSEDLHHIPYFSLFERSGFIYSPRSKGKRIKDIKLLEEGSIFREQVLGTLVPVASEEFAENYHQVYKNGQGFYINIGKIKEDS
jgi:CRISPR type III-A-associated RAMP protein Csm4